jgi:hypothetical protein
VISESIGIPSILVTPIVRYPALNLPHDQQPPSPYRNEWILERSRQPVSPQPPTETNGEGHRRRLRTE